VIGVESWNRSALSWAELAWQASFGSLAVLVAVAIIWLAVRKRVSAHVGHWLFLLPLVPLVLPTGILGALIPDLGESALRVAPLAEIAPRVMGESRGSAPERVVIDPAGPAALPSRSVAPGATGGAPARADARPTPIAWVFIAWALTALALLARFVAVQILWFFQPVAWIANRLVEELRECACDEAALARGADVPRRRCAEALLRVAELAARGGPRSHLALQTFHAPKAILERRIMRILDPQRAVRAGVTLAALPLLLATAAGSLGLAGVLVDVRIPAPPLGEEQEEIVEILDHRGPVDPAEDEAGLLEAIRRGLAFLGAAQAEDGGWYAGPDSSAPSSGEFDRVGVTALVLLNLYEAVYIEGHEPAPEMVAGALSWLASVQDPSTGAFGAPCGPLVMPSHALATVAWMRVRRELPEETWRPVAEKAVRLIESSRNRYAAWRYSVIPNGDNDSFVTSLMLLALAEARDAGIELEPVREGRLSWIDEMTDPKTGRTGYDRKGSPISRLATKAELFPVEYSEMLTAMAITARMRWGEEPAKSNAIQQGALLVTGTAPQWSPDRGTIDYYHWLFGTEAMKALGGYQWDHWRAALLEATLPRQSDNGSWPAIDAWSSEGSAVHATAVVTLALLHARQ